jgi:hypothetical protein
LIWPAILVSEFCMLFCMLFCNVSSCKREKSYRYLITMILYGCKWT